jgi:hypothetical protein
VSLDGNLARLCDELSAATSRREVADILHGHREWISRLSRRSHEQLCQVVTDIYHNRGFAE